VAAVSAPRLSPDSIVHRGVRAAQLSRPTRAGTIARFARTIGYVRVAVDRRQGESVRNHLQHRDSAPQHHGHEQLGERHPG
jgi:hypothetical protein